MQMLQQLAALSCSMRTSPNMLRKVLKDLINFLTCFPSSKTAGKGKTNVANSVQRLLMAGAGERDISAQEVTLLVMSWPLYKSSRTFVKVHLDEGTNNRRLRDNPGKNATATNKVIVPNYLSR